MADNKKELTDEKVKVEKKSAEKNKPEKKKEKFTVRIKKFLKDYKSETKKITWPTKDQVVKNTSIVLVAIIAVSVMVGVLDLSFVKIIELLGQIV